MARAAAGGYSGGDGRSDAAGASGGERVQVGDVGGLKLAPARFGARESAESVNDEQDDLGIGLAAYFVQVWEVNHDI